VATVFLADDPSGWLLKQKLCSGTGKARPKLCHFITELFYVLHEQASLGRDLLAPELSYVFKNRTKKQSSVPEQARPCLSRFCYGSIFYVEELGFILRTGLCCRC
jgi:hypothetical protein